MTTSSTVLEDSSLLSRMDRALLQIERFMALLTGLAIFSLMFLAVYSVLGRKFFASPLLGYVDYIEGLMPLVAIFGVSYVQREGEHIRMDMLISKLKGRPLWLAELSTVLLVAGLMFFLTWGAWSHFERSFDCLRPLCSRDSSADAGLPIWPSKLIVPIAFATLFLRLVLQAIGYSRALWFGLDHPVVVPLTQSVEIQVQKEIDQLTEKK